jgi:hypothetical protein
MHCRSRRAYQVDRTEAIDALILANDVDVAAAPLLEIADSFTTTSNDKTNGPIWYHDLESVFAFFQRGWLSSMGRTSVVASGVQASTGDRAHAAILDDPVDGGNCLGPSSTGTCDLADSSLVAGAGCGHKLNSAMGLLLDAPKILSLAPDDQTHKARLNLHGLGVVITASPSTSTSRR